MDEKIFKKYIVKEEEDVDYLGNKGFFQAKQDFKLAVLLGGKEIEDLDLLLKRLALEEQYFAIIKIEDVKNDD